MPPRVLKRPSSSSFSSPSAAGATAAERKPPLKPPFVEEHTALYHDHHHRRPPRREENGDNVIIPRMMDKSDGLELGSNNFFTDAEENGRANVQMEERWEMEGKGEKEYGEERISGEYMMKDNDLPENMVDKVVGDEHGEGLGGFEDHHDVVKERRKRKEFEVFVGGLDRDAIEEDLRKVFSQVGEITELRLLKNPVTKKNKGYAFLRFATVEQARRAVNELKNPVINGKECGVAPCQDNDTLFVGNICKEWTKETLKEKLARYGVKNFEELTLVEDIRNEGKNRGFAFLGFFSRADAVEACKLLQKRDVVFGTDRSARVAFADNVNEPDEEIMLQVRKVFIDGLPSTWSEDLVNLHFKKFGLIEKVELARDMPAARRTDFGFITFDTHDAAVACVAGIDNAELSYGDSKVKVRARLTRPRQRGKPDKHRRGGYPVAYGGHWDFKASQASSISSMDPWELMGHSRTRTGDSAYDDGTLKSSLGHKNRHPILDVLPKTFGRRRQLTSSERSFSEKSPAYEMNFDGDYIYEDESFPGPSDFARIPVKRQSNKDDYSLPGSGSLESARRTVSHGVARRIPPLYDDDDDDSYARYMEQSSSYRDSHSRDYSSISSSKRPYSAIEEAHPHSGEPSMRQPGPHLDYGRSRFHSSYSAGSSGSAPSRLRHGSRTENDRGRHHHTRPSHGQYDPDESSMRCRRGEISREDEEVIYYTYGGDYVSPDYVPSRSELGAGSYSPPYSSGRMTDGYSRRRRSDLYY